MIEYPKLRDDVLAISQQSGSFPRPCLKGKASCCTGTVPIAFDDWQVIKVALERGKIPAGTWDTAAQKAKQLALITSGNLLANNKCPFLDQANLCTIYRYRPLLCMANDIAFSPLIEGFSEQEILALIAQLDSQPDAKMPVAKVTGRLCPGCFQGLKDAKVQIPGKLLALGNAIERYIVTHRLITIPHFLAAIGKQVSTDLTQPDRRIGNYDYRLGPSSGIPDADANGYRVIIT